MANSPEYRTIIQLTPQLTTAFRDDLIVLSGELLADGLISSNNAASLRNPHNDANYRASQLVGLIRNKIELDPKSNYKAFIDVLKQRLADHKSILRHLDEKYKEFNGTVKTGIAAALSHSGTSKAPDVGAASHVQGSNMASTSAAKFDPLDQEIDYGSRAPTHIGQIADMVTQWEGPLSDGLELSPPDVEDIKNKHPKSLKLQTKAALLMWKEREGRQATYNNLIKIFEGAGNRECADFIRYRLNIAESQGANGAGGSDVHVHKRNITKTPKANSRTVRPDFSDLEDSPEESRSREAKKPHRTNGGGHGHCPSKSTVVMGILVIVVGVCAVVYTTSTPRNLGVHKSESEQTVPMKTTRNRDSNSMDSRTKGEEIEKLNDLIQAVKDVGDWKGLCRNLDVDDGKMDTLINNPNSPPSELKAQCLTAYFKSGNAKWSKVVEAVAKYPVSDGRLAKMIANDHGVPFEDKKEL